MFVCLPIVDILVDTFCYIFSKFDRDCISK